MKNSFIWIILVVVIFIGFIGASVWYKNQGAGGGMIPDFTINQNDYVKGKGPVQIIEYSDFQCPACRAYYPIVEEVINRRGEQITFVYRHFPLPQHFNAYPSSQAAEAAGKQGKFFEMGYLLFLDQSKWENLSSSEARNIFREFATSLGLDMAKFDIDYDNSEIKNKIRNDYKSGVKLGVNATPTFFVNGEKLTFTEANTNEDVIKIFEKAIDEALKDSGVTTQVATGTVESVLP